MSDRRLVSIVCGTWQRHELLLEAIENVRQQTYRPLEHVICADGPDDALAELVHDNLVRHRWSLSDDDDAYVPITFQELGFHSSSVLANSISAAPFMVAQLLAHGEYQITMSDDERFLEPDAIAKLVACVEEYDLDFAYSRVRMHWKDQTGSSGVIGMSPPQCGQITQFLYRRDALDKGMLFRTHVGSGTDWDAVHRTMQAGGRWGFVREVLASHRVDK